MYAKCRDLFNISVCADIHISVCADIHKNIQYTEFKIFEVNTQNTPQ
jgi:hypothetical protein